MDIHFTSEDAYFPPHVIESWIEFLDSFNEHMADVFREAGIEKNVGLLAVMLNQSIEAIYGLDEEGEW